MFNSIPYNVVFGPAEVWEAPVGTAFPTVVANPADPWVKVGTNGARDYTEDGVTFKKTQTVEKFRGLAGTGVKKYWRTEDDLMISLVLADVTIESLTRMLNYNPVTEGEASGGAETDVVGLSLPAGVEQRALLVRVPSPYMDGGVLQFEIPIVSQIGSPELKFAKSTPAGVQLDWTAIEDPDAANDYERYGRVRAQTAAAT